MPHGSDIGPLFAQLPVLRQLFRASYVAWALIELGIVARDLVRVGGRRGDKGSMAAIVIGILLGLLCASNLARVGAARIPGPPEVLVPAGLVLVWAGITLRLWAIWTLGRFFRVTVTIHDDHRLVETGPYLRLRNPSYTGSLITLAGIGLAIGNWLSLAAIILLPAIGFAMRIRIEEAALTDRFGADYEAYRRRRWALVPPLW